jgi:hypothetical protein
MKISFRCFLLAAGILFAQICMAQAPAGAPSGATGLCNDGTYYTGASKQGACRGHKGVKDWYAAPTASAKAAAPAASSSSAAPAPTAAAAPAAKSTANASTAAPAAKPTASSSAAAPAAKPARSAMAQAPGGGAGQVWVNTPTNVYHCPGSQYYGKTKTGAYMTEAEAKAKGAHPDHGKPCQ